MKRAPGRGAGRPRAFALAPGGDSGAVPTSMALRAGNRKGHSKWMSVLSKFLITCDEYRSSVVASILGLSPRSLNLRISPGTAP